MSRNPQSDIADEAEVKKRPNPDKNVIQLADQPIGDWWIEDGTGYALPRFGGEVLGDDF